MLTDIITFLLSSSRDRPSADSREADNQCGMLLTVLVSPPVSPVALIQLPLTLPPTTAPDRTVVNSFPSLCRPHPAAACGELNAVFVTVNYATVRPLPALPATGIILPLPPDLILTSVHVSLTNHSPCCGHVTCLDQWEGEPHRQEGGRGNSSITGSGAVL